MKNKISIGIIAYNEEKNIENVINSIPNNKEIIEIIVVSSECTDNTEKIVKEKQKKNKKIKLICETKRNGKYFSINNFIKQSRGNILVLISADITPKKNSIILLCKPFSDKKIGIVASRPIPTNNGKDIISYFVRFQWELHHEISKIKPKFGEMIAFRKIFNEIPPTAVDEEEIARIIYSNELKGIYEPNAIIYNHGPETLKELIIQRKRIFVGHLKLKKINKYYIPTMNNMLIIKQLLKIKNQNLIKTTICVLLESIIRILGFFEYINGKDHNIWEISTTTKKNIK